MPRREFSIFPECVAKGSHYSLGVWGLDPCSRRVVAGSSRARRGRVAGGSLIPCRGDWWWACHLGGAVSLGLLGRASSGWRRVIGIAGQGVVWVALCHWDCWARRRLGGGGAVSLGLLAARRLGGSVSWGLLGTAWSGRRRVILIAGEGPGVVCVGGVVCGWRPVIVIGGQGDVWVALCHWHCWARRHLGGAV